MDDDLTAFLGPLTPFTEEMVTWPTAPCVWRAI